MRYLRFAFTVLLIVFTAAAWADAYKWVDKNGDIHYSDQPHPGAQKLELGGPQTFKPPPAPRLSIPATGPQQPVTVYPQAGIVSPQAEQTFWNTREVEVSLNLGRSLREGDDVVYLYDGRPTPGSPTTDLSITLQSVDRGTHTIQARIDDATGKTVATTPTVTFHVHQHSRLNKPPQFRHKTPPG